MRQRRRVGVLPYPKSSSLWVSMSIWVMIEGGKQRAREQEARVQQARRGAAGLKRGGRHEGGSSRQEVQNPKGAAGAAGKGSRIRQGGQRALMAIQRL